MKNRKKAKTKLPVARLEKIEKIYVDPVALVGILVAVVLLAVMVVGALQLQEDWAEYQRMSDYVSQLKHENAQLTHQYRSSYDLEDVRIKALALGMIPKSEAQTITVSVTLPEPEPEYTWVDHLVWFWEGLWA